jgi:hypothetical protein
VIAFILFIYNLFGFWSNLEFIGQKSGVVWKGLYLLFGTQTGSRVLVALAFGWFLFTLLFEVRRDPDAKELHKIEPVKEPDPPKVTAGAPKVETAKPKSERSPQPHQVGDRIIANVTPKYLASFFDEHTDIQANRLVKQYIDKWLNVSGVVFDVRSTDVGTSIGIGPDSAERPFVVAYFREQQWIDRAELLRKGDHVTLIGRIVYVDSAVVRLTDSEIIDVTSPGS